MNVYVTPENQERQIFSNLFSRRCKNLKISHQKNLKIQKIYPKKYWFYNEILKFSQGHEKKLEKIWRF